MTKADKFTTVRIAFAPIFLAIYIIPEYFETLKALTGYVMLPLLIFVEFTDFLDGFYARKMKNVSDFGKLYDPFADVILHLGTFFCYVHSGYFSFIILVLLFYRESGMLFLRMIAAKKGVAVGARKGGKVKTVLYIAASFVCLIIESMKRIGIKYDWIDNNGSIIINIMVWLCVVLSYASFIDYLVTFRNVLSKEKK